MKHMKFVEARGLLLSFVSHSGWKLSPRETDILLRYYGIGYLKTSPGELARSRETSAQRIVDIREKAIRMVKIFLVLDTHGLHNRTDVENLSHEEFLTRVPGLSTWDMNLILKEFTFKSVYRSHKPCHSFDKKLARLSPEERARARVQDLSLVRSVKVILRRENIHTVGELESKDKRRLGELAGLSSKRRQTLIEKLEDYGIKLKS